MSKNCETCEYAVPIVDGKEVQIKLECWRMPPQIMVTSASSTDPFVHSMVKFPDVSGIEFCYEYKEEKK